jgi:hypothetical protein
MIGSEIDLLQGHRRFIIKAKFVFKLPAFGHNKPNIESIPSLHDGFNFIHELWLPHFR